MGGKLKIDSEPIFQLGDTVQLKNEHKALIYRSAYSDIYGHCVFCIDLDCGNIFYYIDNNWMETRETLSSIIYNSENYISII